MLDEMYDNLKDLIQVDIDAVGAYEQALDKIEDPDIREHLVTFREDHQRHIIELSSYLMRNGKEPPKQSPDFKGFMIGGFTSLRSITGTDGALKAMKSNEKLTNKEYDEAVNWELDPTARTIIEKGRKDEQAHLAYIEEQLTIRV